jgi:hypothetical protein
MSDTQDVEALVARLEAAIGLSEKLGARGSHPSNIFNLADQAATALSTLARERDERDGWVAHWQTKCQATAGLLSTANARASSLEAQLAGVKEALEPFKVAHDAYVAVMQNGLVTGETFADRRHSEGEMRSSAEEAAFEALADITFDQMRAVAEALASAPASAGVGVKALEWSDPSPPNDDCRYDHVVAATPWGPMRIEWKGWKQHDSYSVFRDGFFMSSESALDAAKAAAQDMHEADILSCLTPSEGRDGKEVRWVRHKKRGTTYDVLGLAEGQIATPDITLCGNAGRFVTEGVELTVYRATDGKLYWRFPDEFEDGRFEDIPTTPEASHDR